MIWLLWLTVTVVFILHERDHRKENDILHKRISALQERMDEAFGEEDDDED